MVSSGIVRATTDPGPSAVQSNRLSIMVSSIVVNIYKYGKALILEHPALFIAICTIIAVYHVSSSASKHEPVRAPTVKFFGPDIISRLLFNVKASTLIYRGYRKVPILMSLIAPMTITDGN